MQQYIKFNHGRVQGYVPAEAYKTFVRKHDAVDSIMQARENGVDADTLRLIEIAAMKIIQAANRKIGKKWFLLDERTAQHYASIGHIEII